MAAGSSASDDGSAQFAVAKSIPRAANAKSQRRRPARHRLEKRNAEPLPGRRHDEEVGHAIGVDEAFRTRPRPESARDPQRPASRARSSSRATIVTIAEHDIDDVMTRGDKLRQRLDHAIVTLVALARVHAPDGQEHALAFKPQCRAQ